MQKINKNQNRNIITKTANTENGKTQTLLNDNKDEGTQNETDKLKRGQQTNEKHMSLGVWIS